MEAIKEFYWNHPDSKVVFGETSRSDTLDEEQGSNEIRMMPNFHDKRERGKISFPQPKLAKNHTADNVCLSTVFFI